MDLYWQKTEAFEKQIDANDSLELCQRNLSLISFEPNDVLVVGCQKTGTTWLLQILHQIRVRGAPAEEEIYKLVKRIPPHFAVPHALQKLNAPQAAKPNLFKISAPFDWAPQALGLRYIVILRNPQDRCYSAMKFAARYVCGVNEDLSSKDMLRMLTGSMAKPSCGMHCLEQFIVSWWPHRKDANVLWLHFEDLKADLGYCVKRIASFIGVNLSDDEFERILGYCLFEYMSANKEKFVDRPFGVFAPPGETWKPLAFMVRPGGGQVGQGSSNLPQELRTFLEEQWKIIVEPKTGFASYADLYSVSSLLNENIS